jgi:predicted small secreted protein
MNRLTDIAARRPRLAWALTVLVAVVVAGCKNEGGSGY